MNVVTLFWIITNIPIFLVCGLTTPSCQTGLDIPLNVFAVLRGKRYVQWCVLCFQFFHTARLVFWFEVLKVHWTIF